MIYWGLTITLLFFWEAYRNNELYENGLSPSCGGGGQLHPNLVSALGYNPYEVAEPVDNQGQSDGKCCLEY